MNIRRWKSVIDHQQKFGWYEYYVEILIYNSVTQRFLK